MNTLAALGIAGAAGVALYLVERKTATPAVAPRPVSTGGDPVSGFLNRVGQIGAGAAATGAGLGAVAPVIGKAGGGFLSAEYGGFKQAGSGVTQIAQGNVISGTKNIVVGGVKTAAAPLTSAYNAVRSIL
jgi:hypothetical protein